MVPEACALSARLHPQGNLGARLISVIQNRTEGQRGTRPEVHFALDQRKPGRLFWLAWVVEPLPWEDLVTLAGHVSPVVGQSPPMLLWCKVKQISSKAWSFTQGCCLIPRLADPWDR